MASEMDQLAEELEKEVWASYTEAVRDHAKNPRNAGSMPNADGFAVVTGPCGDTMKIWLRVKEKVIRQATFWTDGCGPSIASGSMVTELAKGKSIPGVMRIAHKDVLEALPAGGRHLEGGGEGLPRLSERTLEASLQEAWNRLRMKDPLSFFAIPPKPGSRWLRKQFS